MSRENFDEIMGRVAAAIGDKPLDAALAKFLNETFPADGEDFEEDRAQGARRRRR